MTYSTLNPLNSFELAFFDKYFVTSRKKKKKKGIAKSGQKIDIYQIL